MSDSTPAGFRFAGIHCGIKPEKPDLALIVSEVPCVAAGVYTQNLVRAACIDWNRAITPSMHVRAVVVNSGNANACTGRQGIDDNQAMAEGVANAIGATAREVLVLSTGVIGRPMPMSKVLPGIESAVAAAAPGDEAFHRAATAIMTTDHQQKTRLVTFTAGGNKYHVAAMAKGAGMIGPAMATMLAVIATDFPMTLTAAETNLRHAVKCSFNRISVEGHTSTNDAAILLAPAASETESSDGVLAFQNALNRATLELAKMIPADGEGASHLIHILVSGTSGDEDADRIARTIAMSNLVKTAVSGADPNWGRIVSAAGYTGVQFDVNEVSLLVNGILLFDRGEPVPFDAKATSRAIRESFECRVELAVGPGGGAAEHYTSDLTADYVRLNADYTT